MRLNRTTPLIFLGFCLAGTQAAALTINPTSNGSDLTNEILGSGITVDNSSINYIGEEGQAATFTDGLSADIGIDSGILLTTGKAADAVGPNTSDGTTTAWGTAGDATLDALVGAGSTNDANVLEFDFESTGGDLFFNYVFASEEYNEFVDSAFNDVFAFTVDGVNIATIGPDNDPVTINNVNCGNPFGSADNHCDSYNNNDLDDGGTLNVEYDGLTDVFTASILGLSPGKHTMKLAIADRGDHQLDSGVFIEGGSFSDKPTTKVPEPGILSLFGLGLIGLGISRRRSANRHLV